MIDKPSSKCRIFGNEYLAAGQIRRLLLVEEERQFLFYPLIFWFYALSLAQMSVLISDKVFPAPTPRPSQMPTTAVMVCDNKISFMMDNVHLVSPKSKYCAQFS
jgi:hypothetical protein